MMQLTGSEDESIIFVLEDGSEIEITVIELEGNKSKVLVCTDIEVSVIRRLMENQD